MSKRIKVRVFILLYEVTIAKKHRLTVRRLLSDIWTSYLPSDPLSTLTAAAAATAFKDGTHGATALLDGYGPARRRVASRAVTGPVDHLRLAPGDARNDGGAIPTAMSDVADQRFHGGRRARAVHGEHRATPGRPRPRPTTW